MEETPRRGVRTRGGRSRGSDPQKRTFAPTIPQRRVKTEEEPKKDSTEAPKNEKYRGGRGRGRGRGRREYIQTEGAPFGQGVSSTEKKAVRDTSYVKEAENIQMPVYKAPKLKTKKELEEEEMKFEDDSDWSSDGEQSEYFVQLPLGYKKSKQAKIKNGVRKREEGDDETVFGRKPLFRAFIKQEIKSEDEETGEIKATNEIEDPDMLLFLQLPTLLPFEKRKTEELVDPRTKAGASTEQPQSSGETTVPNFVEDGSSLQDMQEGRFGTLQILRSGKMRLAFGPLRTNVDVDYSVSFVQEVVTIRKAEEQFPEVVSLGFAKNVLRCSPDIQKYLSKQIEV